MSGEGVNRGVAVTRARDWLLAQVGSSPPELIEMMLGAMPEIPDQPVAEILVGGAMALYAAVVDGTGGREDALALLAADALFTHAFQAQAEFDPQGLSAYVRLWTEGARLSALLADPETAPA